MEPQRPGLITVHQYVPPICWSPIFMQILLDLAPLLLGIIPKPVEVMAVYRFVKRIEERV